ncbi:CHC2 zinc finger domain-containing protein [Clostridium sp.]|uniref:CHC2 zinc finger domain-containing protein n=1 Tax=Clostridium sp. TaxID=1506 RepID=UPI0028459F7B|nr:CHC2 zinc finger domain-containing protein [Clostridium sp.]MDR3597688.1 CHC2 zinc finger domain-containing protein [Clostridium sp.]
MNNRFDINSIFAGAGLIQIDILNKFNIQVDGRIGANILCPFHEDSSPSMQLNDDGTCHCYACNVHIDLIQLYTALKMNDLEVGKNIYSNKKLLSEIIKEMNYKFNLNINLGEELKDEAESIITQLKELNLDKIKSEYLKKNPPMYDYSFSNLEYELKEIYLYKDAKEATVIAIKARYEMTLKNDAFNDLYVYKNGKYIKKKIKETKKKKTFKFYDITNGKIAGNVLPEQKKNLIYNCENINYAKEEKKDYHKKWIWFVEGEKDVNTLKEYGMVGCSLMKGANSNWVSEYNELFIDTKVIIAGDFDEAGEKYDGTLFYELDRATYLDTGGIKKNCLLGLKKLNKQFYKINNMEVGSDITDLVEHWKTEELEKKEIYSKLTEIIERSIDSRGSELKENYKGIFSGNEQIADFTVVEAVNIISKDSSQADKLKLTIKGVGEHTKKHTIVADVNDFFLTPDNFNKTFSTMECTFLGTKAQLAQLKTFVRNYKMFEENFIFSKNGMYKFNDEWILVTPEGALLKDGSVSRKIFSSNNTMYNEILNIKIPTGEEINKVVPALINFNTKDIVYNVLGEVGCKLLNARYKDLGIKNHLFSLNGSKGAGKTETSVKIIATMTNNNTKGEYNLTGQSNFTFLKNVSSNNIGGIILQELKMGKMSLGERNKWSEIFRNNYDRARSQRGTKSQNINEYDHNNPIIITGEEGIGSESALYERFNLIFMTSEKRNTNPEYTRNFRTLCDNQEILKGIGKQMVIDIMNLKDEEIIKERERVELKIRKLKLDEIGFIDRILSNAINVIHGITLMSEALIKLGANNEIDLEEAFECIIDNFRENVLRLNDSNSLNDDYKNMLIEYQQAIDNKFTDKVIGKPENGYCIYNKKLYISPSKIRTIIANFVEASKSDITLLIENEFKKHLFKSGYIYQDVKYRKKFNKENAKGWYYEVRNIDKLKNIGLDFIDELIQNGEITYYNDDDFIKSKPSKLERIKNKELILF